MYQLPIFKEEKVSKGEKMQKKKKKITKIPTNLVSGTLEKPRKYIIKTYIYIYTQIIYIYTAEPQERLRKPRGRGQI